MVFVLTFCYNQIVEGLNDFKATVTPDVSIGISDQAMQNSTSKATDLAGGPHHSILITRSSHRCAWCGFEPRSGHM